MSDLGVVLGRELVDWKEMLVCIESEVSYVIIGEVPSISAVADNKELDKTEKRSGVSVTGVVLVVDDLFHCSPGADSKRLQFDLNNRYAVNQEHDIVSVMAIVGIDAKLIDELEGILAPVLDINQSVVERCAVFSDERFPIPEGLGSCIHVGSDNLVEDPVELAIGQRDTIQGIEFFPEIRF